MASAPIKFRCFRCNQLLGVSRSKAGAVVPCPKCQIELIVPDPEEPAVRAGAGSSSRSHDGGISLDILNIRPEDIRVEPGIEPLAPPPALAPSPVLVESPPAPMYSPDEVMNIGEPQWPVATAAPRATRVEVAPPPAARVAPQPQRPAAPIQPLEGMPAIQIDDGPVSSRSRIAPTSVRSRDLVLPRSVVASWSLFVILALVFAFTAGLLAGHYLWRVH